MPGTRLKFRELLFWTAAVMIIVKAINIICY